MAGDEQDILESAKEALESLGYAVITAATGEEALQIFKDGGWPRQKCFFVSSKGLHQQAVPVAGTGGHGILPAAWFLTFFWPQTGKADVKAGEGARWSGNKGSIPGHTQYATKVKNLPVQSICPSGAWKPHTADGEVHSSRIEGVSMGRFARFVLEDRPTVYHIMSRTTLEGFPLQAEEKDYLMAAIARLCRFYFVDLLGFCLMGNHFHLVIRMHTAETATDKEIVKRFTKRLGGDDEMTAHQIHEYRRKLVSLGAFVKDVKQSFTQYYNRRWNRRGFFWGERYKSLIVQEGLCLVNLLAYVDLNPVRAGLVQKPEDYHWNTLGYLVQSGNSDGLVSLDLGMDEWDELDSTEIIRKYREFVYATGAVDVGKDKAHEESMDGQKRKKKSRVSREDVFRGRCRYFTESGVIGSKEFVGEVFDAIKHLLDSKDTRRFTPVSGVEGVYSMKRLNTLASG